MEVKLTAEKRRETGKSHARKLRREGKIPGVIYGSGIDPCPISLKLEDFRAVLHGGTISTTLLDLELTDGESTQTHLAMVKEVQRHPYKDRILHVDFVRVERSEKVTARVPITIQGEEASRGLRAGGTLQHVLWEVEIECLPVDLPEHVVADIKELRVGEHLEVSNLLVPEGVRILDDPESVVLTILAPRIAVAVEAEEEAAAEGAPSESEKEGS